MSSTLLLQDSISGSRICDDDDLAHHHHAARISRKKLSQQIAVAGEIAGGTQHVAGGMAGFGRCLGDVADIGRDPEVPCAACCTLPMIFNDPASGP